MSKQKSEARKKREQAYRDKQEQKLLRYYRPGITREGLAEKTGFHQTKIKTFADKNNLTFAPDPYYTSRHKDRIIELSQQGKNAQYMADELGLTVKQVYYLRRKFLPPEKKKTRVHEAQLVQSIEKVYHPDMDVTELHQKLIPLYPRLTKGRVGEVCRKNNYILRRKKTLFEQHRQQISSLLQNPDLSLKDIAEIMGLTYPQVLTLKFRCEKGTDRRRKSKISQPEKPEPSNDNSCDDIPIDIADSNPQDHQVVDETLMLF